MDLNYQSILAQQLLRPRPVSRLLQNSVMVRPDEAPPQINPDSPLENVSPEDWIPNPKSLIMALKGIPILAAGMIKSKPNAWSESVVRALNIKKLEEPTFASYDKDKQFPQTYNITLPNGRNLDLPEGAVSAHVKAYEKSLKDANKKLVPPPKEELDRVNAAGNAAYGNEGSGYIPYGIPGMQTHYQELTKDQFLKRFPNVRADKTGDYNYSLGIQGLAHGVDKDGNFLPLHTSNEIQQGTTVASHTETPFSQTIFKIK